jgi:peptidyl-prolyl cis-trans isomerase D
MLDLLRQGAQGWLSKVLMGLLVVSFAIWGIGGFQGYGAGTLARVGDVEVGVDEFGLAYSQAQRAAQAGGQQPAPDQVLSRLLYAAALDDAASDGGLGVSQDRVADEIAKDPTFHSSGAFDRERFDALLANSGFSRDAYIHDVHRDLVRRQIAQTIGSGVAAPQPLVEALYQLQNEERTISYVAVDEAAIEPVGTPEPSALQAYFDENKDTFRAPEYRKLALLVLDPEGVADPAAVTPEDVQAEYDQRKATLTRPERRRFEQIRFPSAGEAEAALAEIESGTDFAAVADARGLTPADIDQGLKTRAEILDPAVAEAAFAIEQGKVVAVTEGAVEPSLIRVTEIQPGSVTPLAEVEPRLRHDIAVRTAAEHVNELYDQVEDARAGGATLEEVSKSTALPYRVVEGVSADLKAPDGSAVTDIPGGADVVKEAFESDVGVENSPVRAGSSHVFYEVLEIIPERERSLHEVRDQAVAAWTAAETAKRIEEKANSLFERLKSGEQIATIAAEIGKPVETVEGMKRGTPPAGLSQNAAAQAFAGPEGHVANAEGDASARILLRVDRVVTPAFFAEAADAKTINEQLTEAMRNEMLATYNRQLLEARETTINNAALQQITGQIQAQ